MDKDDTILIYIILLLIRSALHELLSSSMTLFTYEVNFFRSAANQLLMKCYIVFAKFKMFNIYVNMSAWSCNLIWEHDKLTYVKVNCYPNVYRIGDAAYLFTTNLQINVL